ncbi:MAG: geranylgeranylglycerol-phosphate geranylgeranyltransferase [Candidatus Latescibacterota bacterium]
MNSILGLYRITRPGNVLVCALSVISGGLIGGKPLDLLNGAFLSLLHGEGIPSWLLRVIFAALSASLVLAAGNVYNDVRDLKADRVNAPNRPLPSGLITPGAATFYAAALAFSGILLALPLGIPSLSIAVSAVVLLAIYDVHLKGAPFVGNILVALLGGVIFLYGGIAGNAVVPALIPALFATLFHLGREIIKDAADLRGDREAGIRTLATERGVHQSAAIAAGVFFLLAILATLPAACGRFGMGYLLIIALGVWPVLAYTTASSLIHPTEANLRRVALLLKLDMPVGILAVLAGFQGW